MHQNEGNGEDDKKSQRFHHASEDFDEQVKGHAQHAGGSVPGVENHVAVLPQGLGQHKLPAAALAGQHAQFPRGFRPANGIGSKDHAKFFFLGDHITAYGRDYVDVLGNGIVSEAARSNDRLAVQKAEAARSNKRRVQHAPARTSEQERANVFHDLASLQPARGQRHSFQTPVAQRASIGNAYDAAADHHILRGMNYRGHQPEQSVALDDGISVHSTEVGTARKVDAAVQCVGLAAVFDLDNEKL